MSVFALQLNMFIMLVNTLSKVQEDLLPEAQSGMVIKLLEEVGNSVRKTQRMLSPPSSAVAPAPPPPVPARSGKYDPQR